MQSLSKRIESTSKSPFLLHNENSDSPTFLLVGELRRNVILILTPTFFARWNLEYAVAEKGPA
jgi:hypothetical protein